MDAPVSAMSRVGIFLLRVAVELLLVVVVLSAVFPEPLVLVPWSAIIYGKG